MASAAELRMGSPPRIKALPNSGEVPVRVVAGVDMLRQRHQILSRLSRSLTIGTPAAWAEVLRSELLGLMDFDFFDAIVYSKNSNELLWNLCADERRNNDYLPIQGSLFWWVYHDQKPLLILDSHADQGSAAAKRLIRLKYRSFCGLPLSTRNGCFGVLGLASSRPNSFTPDDLEFLAQVATQLSLAIENWLTHRAVTELQDSLAQGRVHEDGELSQLSKLDGISETALHKALRQIERGTRDDSKPSSAEEILRRNEAYLGEAQRLVRTGSWAWDPHRDEMLHCSREIYRIYGIDPADGVPTFDQLTQRIHPHDRDWVRKRTMEGVQQKVEHLLDYRIVLPDGTQKYIQSIRRPILDETGNVVEIVGTSVDVTERKRAEQLEADLAHTNRVSMLGELASSISHELKQPIAATILNARAIKRWLSRDQPDLEEVWKAVDRIEKDGSRASEIINRLRSLYKKAPPNRELVDVNEIVSEIVALLEGEATRDAVTIRSALAADLPQVTADRVQIQQVLMNLMFNGIEAMSETGGVLTVQSQPEDGYVVISVSDTGVGLPREQAGRIFDAFFTTKPQGSGMGLAISRSIIESHGGRLWATPNDGRGAKFYFALPSPADKAKIPPAEIGFTGDETKS